MKTIKLNYCAMGYDFNPEQNLIYDLLKIQGFDVQISPEPDYLICNFSEENHYAYCGKPQVRIMHSGENYIPDFNLIDYSICPYPISFGDRNFCLPPYVWPREHWQSLAKKDRSRAQAQKLLSQKQYFASFITSHESEFGIRGDFFKKLSRYKRVESPGSYLYNMDDGTTVRLHDESKTDFQRKCKFSLCFESTNHYGFVTEKITDAFYADTIPIYYGSTTAAEVFNRDAFINVADYDSFDDAIARIIQLDQDDEAYVRMLSQPILVDPEYPARLERELGEYVRHIFEQPLEKAYRRSRVYHPQMIDDFLAKARIPEEMTMVELERTMKRKVVRKIRKKKLAAKKFRLSRKKKVAQRFSEHKKKRVEKRACRSK